MSPRGRLPSSGDCSRPGHQGLPAPAQHGVARGIPALPPGHPLFALLPSLKPTALGLKAQALPPPQALPPLRTDPSGPLSPGLWGPHRGEALSHRPAAPAHRPHAPRNPEGSLRARSSHSAPSPPRTPSLPGHGGAGGRKGELALGHMPLGAAGCILLGPPGPVLRGRGAPRAVPTSEPPELQAGLTFCPHPARPVHRGWESGCQAPPCPERPCRHLGGSCEGGRRAVRSWNALRARGPTTVSTHRLRQQEARPETTLRRRAAHHRGAPAGPAGALPLPHSGSAASAPRGPSGLAAAPGQYLDFARGGCSQSPRGCTPPSCLVGSGRWRWDYRHLPPLQAFDLPENSSCVWGNLADERPPWAVLPGGPRHCPPGRHEAEGGEDAWAEWPPGPTVREVPGAAGVKDASAPPCSASSSAERASLLMPVLPEPRAHMDPAARGSRTP